MPKLRIELLGDFRLTLDDTPVTSVNSPRLQALLAYLVLHRHAPQPRSQIAFTFWSDTTEAQAHNNFRQLLFDLRRALPAADSFLEVAGSTLQWRTAAPFSLDVADLENALAAAEQAEQNRDQESEQAALEASALLYRGDLLPSCYDDWIVPARETLRQKSITALERLIELQEQQHDYRKALSHAQHLLRQDPLHEATYRHLMRLHALSGDRAGVVRVYNTCVQVLQRELSVQPSPGTCAEYEHWLKESLSPSRATDRALLPPATPRRHNLPFQLTNFIGRERESSQVKELIATHRLVTLTGSGGVGKTRLALRVAADVLETFSDGVWLVDPAPLSDPALVPQAVATALEIREAAGSPLLNTLADYVRGKRLLLILDNCEHLGEAVRRLAKTLVETAPNLRILATSRESLGIAGEVTWRVPSLPMPEGHSLEERASPGTSASIMQFESLQLFVDRATAVLPTFTVTDANASEVGKICHQLDGIPLAIELAAARVKMLSPQQIAARLDRCFDLLTVGSRTALPRHQTLRATMDWSYQLLAEGERVLLDRLSVFAGSFTVETVEQVCAEKDESAGQIHPSMILDLLSNLIDKSLVVVEQTERSGGKDTETRYRLLETVRQYARGKLLESGKSERVRDKHLEYFLKLVEEAELKLPGATQLTWLNRLETEHDNLRAALDWSQESERGAERGLQLAATLSPFWHIRGYLREGRERISSALAHSQHLGRTEARGKAFCGGAELAYRQSDYLVARPLANEALAIYRELSDKQGIAEALSVLGYIAEEEGDYDTPAGLYKETLALYRELEDERGIAGALLNLGWVAMRLGHYALANSQLEEALAIWQRLGDKHGMTFALSGLAEVAARQGKLEAASRLIEESLALGREIGWKWGIGGSLGTWAWIAMHQRDWDTALVRLRESIGVRKEIGDKGGIAWCLERLAEVAMENNELARAAQIFGAASALRVSMGSVIDPVDQLDHDHRIAMLREKLSEENYSAAGNEGRAMTMEQTIEYALKDS